MRRYLKRDEHTRRHTRPQKVLPCALLLACLGLSLMNAPTGLADVPPGREQPDPAIAKIIEEINESELEETTYDLQKVPTRIFGSEGNREAGEYLYARLADIPGLLVEFQGGELNNIIATLPGGGNTSDEVVIVGAHYDSTSSDPARSPGATDNACGVAIVLELARVMSRHSFDRTVRFAFWNAEESGSRGSTDYVARARDTGAPVVLYLNYDSACYDPEDRFVLDIVYDERSADVAALMAEHNTLYATNFTLTRNRHACRSDHTSFWARGFAALTTHSEEHGPAHTPEDTIDHVSVGYMAGNTRLGLSVLAKVAGPREEEGGAAIPKAPIAG